MNRPELRALRTWLICGLLYGITAGAAFGVLIYRVEALGNELKGAIFAVVVVLIEELLFPSLCVLEVMRWLGNLPAFWPRGGKMKPPSILRSRLPSSLFYVMLFGAYAVDSGGGVRLAMLFAVLGNELAWAIMLCWRSRISWRIKTLLQEEVSTMPANPGH
jgi:hypothetical protein